jgi:hypothetical protein
MEELSARADMDIFAGGKKLPLWLVGEALSGMEHVA